MDFGSVDGMALDLLPSVYTTTGALAFTALTKGNSPGAVALLIAADTFASGTKLWSDRGLIFSTNAFYEARILDEVEVSSSALDSATLGGYVALTVSQIELWNGDRALDAIAEGGTALGRNVTISTVPVVAPSASDVGSALASATTAFKGVTGSFGGAGRTIDFTVTDLAEKLAQPLQPNTYDGSGGMNGTATMKGQPKPVALGHVFNITPVYLGLVDLGDGMLPTYQSNWRHVIGHTAVRERGVDMAASAVKPVVGQYRDWPAQGAFQIGFTADGAITCDVSGDAPGGLYAGSTAGIVSRILTDLGPGLASTDLGNGSFTIASGQLPGEIGWYAQQPTGTAEDAINAILSGAGAILAGARTGKMRMAALAVPVPAAQFTIDAYDIVSLEPVDMPAGFQPIPTSVQIAAEQNWTVQTDIAGSVADPLRSRIAGSGLTATAPVAPIAAQQLLTKILTQPGLYRYETDALLRAQQIAAWLGNGLRAFEIETDKYLGQIEIGHYGTISTYPGYGLDAGWSGVVFAYDEKIGPGNRRATVTMIGPGN